MKPCLAKLAIATLGIAAAFAPAAGAAPLSKAKLFNNSSGKVACGIEIHALNKPATNVICQARGIPGRGNPNAGDPAVQLSVLGTPLLLRVSQDPFIANRATRLGRGRLWNQLGVTCHMARVTVMCFNGDNHGFVIGNGRFREF
jgi:hypothetical protein